MLDEAFAYAGRGWRVFPVHTTISGQCSCGRDCGKDAGKHPRIKEWQKNATNDRAQIERWWKRWLDANIGIATGGGIVVLDLDGPDEISRFQAFAAAQGGLPETLTCQTARGFHLYFAGSWPTTKKVALPGGTREQGLLVRGTGGYVIAPPSWHASGVRYQWAKHAVLAPMPKWFHEWLQTADNPSITTNFNSTLLQQLPAHLQAKAKRNQNLITERAKSALTETPYSAYELSRIESALAAIPANCARDPWLHIGFALHSLHWEQGDGTDLGFEIWNRWSATAPEKYSLHDVETRWRSFKNERTNGVTIATLYHLAEQHGWLGLLPRAAETPKEVMQHKSEHLSGYVAQPHPIFGASGGAQPHINGHASEAAFFGDSGVRPLEMSPLIDLNNRYSCIGDVGGKCLILGFVPSKVDPTVRVPSFQTFKSFSERYANRYVMVQKKKGEGQEEEPAQLGSYWLKWKHRKSFEGIDLVPGAGAMLDGNVLNLWSGYAIEPRTGSWDRMKEHLFDVLADRDQESFDYILRWSAWSLQHPDERAEVATVFRGDKGAGKGTFAHALRRIYGQHGLHISNSKHLVGAFNAHLRNCLMLYADEAFWAGDKQGESVLKALITEPVLMIEQKGIDAAQWKNRIHLIMTANADWVVPASHDERRYAVFNVSNRQTKNENYFKKLHAEMANGGLQAMLHDLADAELGDWHPRRIPATEALREQKIRSMTQLQEWWESILQDGLIPASHKDAPDIAMAQYLLQHAREFAPRLRDLTPAALGRFLTERKCIKLHRATGNAWRFPTLPDARHEWAFYFSGWKWEHDVAKWAVRN